MKTRIYIYIYFWVEVAYGSPLREVPNLHVVLNLMKSKDTLDSFHGKLEVYICQISVQPIFCAWCLSVQ